jgi:8-oxo-dGTP diphosphatase
MLLAVERRRSGRPKVNQPETMSEPPQTDPTARSIDVAVAILRDGDGRVLLCRRPTGARYGDRWEFPGGKLEPGESHLAALRRELREELDVDAPEATLLHAVETRYEDGGIFAVSFFIVESWIGEPRNLAASELVWVAPGELAGYDLLEGSRDVCRLLETASIGDSTDERDSSPT